MYTLVLASLQTAIGSGDPVKHVDGLSGSDRETTFNYSIASCPTPPLQEGGAGHGTDYSLGRVV